MKSSHWATLMLLVGAVAGFAAGDGGIDRNAEAQVVSNEPAALRFQVSAWGFAAASENMFKTERGCYIVDSATGELWSVTADGKPKKISGKLD
jgi:hypothetical protein